MQLLKIGETARLLSISTSTVREWEKTGRLKAVRTPTGRRLFRLEDVERLIPREAVSTT